MAAAPAGHGWTRHRKKLSTSVLYGPNGRHMQKRRHFQFWPVSLAKDPAGAF